MQALKCGCFRISLSSCGIHLYNIIPFIDLSYVGQYWLLKRNIEMNLTWQWRPLRHYSLLVLVDRVAHWWGSILPEGKFYEPICYCLLCNIIRMKDSIDIPCGLWSCIFKEEHIYLSTNFILHVRTHINTILYTWIWTLPRVALHLPIILGNSIIV